MAVKGGLGRGINNAGRGLDSLIAPKKSSGIKKTTPVPAKKEVTGEEVKVKISLVAPNKNQPRKAFEEEALKELAESIKNYGIISPIIVKKKDDFYEIIAGERRWRAAKLAGLKEVPIIVRDYNEQKSAEISLIENIQRENLNPIEEARAYQSLMQEFNLKQEEIAAKVSKSRVFITNSMRLLKLDERVQRMVSDRLISQGHARAILVINDFDKQYELAQRAFHENLSVREVEKLVKSDGKPVVKKSNDISDSLKAVYDDFENKITEAMGTKVSINRKDEKKGKIEISYSSIEELENITAKLIKSRD